MNSVELDMHRGECAEQEGREAWIEELQRSRQYLAEAQKLTHTGSWAWSPLSGSLLYWSEECYRILGFDPARGLPSFDASAERIHPEDRPETLAKIDRYARAGNDFEIEYRLLLPDGLVRNVRIFAHPVRDASGAVVEFIGTVVDVTEQKRTEEERQESRLEARLQATLNMIPAYTWYAAPGGALTFVNERCADYLGLPNDHPLRLGLETSAPWDAHIPLLHPDDQDESREVWAACLATGSAAEFSQRVPNAQGTYRWFLSRAEPLRAADGTLLYWVGINLDIEERKQAEEELHRSRAYLAEAQKVSHTGSWAWNPTSNAIVYWSEECYRLLGHDPATGLPAFTQLMEDVHPEDRPRIAESLEQAVSARSDWQAEYRLMNFVDGPRIVRCMAHPILDGTGQVLEYVGTVMDITEQKRAEEERREYLWFLESMDRVNRAMQRSNDVELMMGGVLEETLAIFGCERTCLVYPCDPDTPTWRVVAERTTPQYAGDFTLEKDFPTSREGAEMFRRLLLQPGPLVDPKLQPDRRAQFRISSMITFAVRPKGDRPYMFAMHQCSHVRAWAAAERRLFEEIARRLEDVLTSVLAHRNLVASQEALQALSRDLQESNAKLEEAQRLTHVGYYEWDLLTGRVNWSDENYRIYGMQPQECPMDIGAVQERIHPEDWQRGMEEAIGGDRFSVECRLFRPTGEMRIAIVQGDVKRDASGKPYRMFGTTQDITDRKRAEAERQEHLWFLESMDRINRLMQRTSDVELMTNGVMQESLAIFGCDRAWLVYPCDPDSPTMRAVMEHTRPEYPGAFALGEEFPVDTQAAEGLRRVLDGPGAVTDLNVASEIRERFNIQSMIAIAVRPKGDRPYLFGLHQCSHARTWTAAESRLFEEITRRLEDALTSVLAYRNLLASEEQLRRSRAYLAEAQRISHTGSWAWNNVTRENIYWSEECFRIHGRDPAQGQPSLEQTLADIHPGDLPGIVASLEKALGEGLEWEGEYRLTNFADGPRTVRSIAHPVLDGSGRVVEYIGTVVDITERRRRERLLLAQFRVTQTLSEASSLENAAPGILRVMCEALEWDLGAFWQVDPDGGVLRCIATWPSAFAAPPKFAGATRAISFGPGMGLPGRVWSSGGPVCIRDVALDPELPRAKTAAKEGLHAAFAFPVKLKSGIVGVIELFSREVRDADRGLLQMMAAIGSQVAQFIERAQATDSLRDARERVAQASKIASLAELSASIAHEINQPLQAIVANGYASLRWLDATPPNIEKAIHSAKHVVRDGNAAAEVVSRIRALFKHAVPAKVDLDINRLILQVRTLMADEIQGNGVSSETELGEDLPRIRADAVQIQQVIVNLVRNAIEAMAATLERPKLLWIRSRREEGNVVVGIQDNGVGLADAEKIFEPFVTTKETGLGMGLAICRSIIEAHAGRIWVARNLERGVTFSFSLPIENSVTG